MLNNVTLIGRLTDDPELRYTQGGTAVATYRLAVDRNYKDADGNKETDFLTIIIWGKLAELCDEYQKKGHKAAVNGRIQTRSYVNNDDYTVYVTEIVAEQVTFLESAPKDDNGGNKSSGNKGSNRSSGNRNGGKRSGGK